MVIAHLNTSGPAESLAVRYRHCYISERACPVISQTTLLHKHNFTRAPKHFGGSRFVATQSLPAPVKSPLKQVSNIFSRSRAGVGFPAEQFHLSGLRLSFRHVRTWCHLPAPRGAAAAGDIPGFHPAESKSRQCRCSTAKHVRVSGNSCQSVNENERSGSFCKEAWSISRFCG